MGQRMDTMLFPQGKRKALTLSYDDGVVQDKRLIEILDRYGLKCTFNIGAGVLGFRGNMPYNGGEVDMSKLKPEEVATVYANHEVAGHGLWHSSLTSVGTPTAMWEIIEDRRQLETLVGKPVRSFAYPFGTYNETVKQLLRLAGYESARTVVSTGAFTIPEDFLEWHATCHHDDPRLMELAETFCEKRGFFPGAQLFYLWGHAYEFEGNDNWDVIETFAAYVSRFADSIWFATNAEIVDYVTAFRRLKYSADASIITNPSAVPVWLGVKRDVYCIAPGESIRIPSGGLYA